MRKFFALAAAFLLACSLIACSQAPGDDTEPEPVVIHYINDNPAEEQLWQALAEAYTRSTGVSVVVVTVLQGYTDALMYDLENGLAPTVFAYRPEAEAYCLSLEGTALSALLPTGIRVDRSFPYAFQKSWGIVANRALLQAAGYPAETLTDYYTLLDAANSIHDRRDILGFDAFTPPSKEDMAAIAPLLKEYSVPFRRFWNLCTVKSSLSSEALDTVTPEMSLDIFGQGKAAFWIQSADVYETLLEQYSMTPNDLVFLPLYSGSKDITVPTCGDWRSWGIAAGATQAQQQAALDFLSWVVTSPKGTAMLAGQYGGSLFPSPEQQESTLLSQSAAQLLAGNRAALADIPGDIPHFSDLYDALIAYSRGFSSWASVKFYLSD